MDVVHLFKCTGRDCRRQWLYIKLGNCLGCFYAAPSTSRDTYWLQDEKRKQCGILLGMGDGEETVAAS